MRFFLINRDVITLVCQCHTGLQSGRTCANNRDFAERFSTGLINFHPGLLFKISNKTL
ncbi:Uncharacterised protein [Shigella flexneri]|nr:Uncharacterised protein [Shigella flexneri]